jgi:outer membrane protein TolC
MKPGMLRSTVVPHSLSAPARWLAACVLATGVAPALATAQTALTIEQALSRALAGHPDIDVSKKTEDVRRSDWLAARSPFDLKLDTFVRSLSDHRRLTGDRLISSTSMNRLGTGVGVEKTLRFGPIVRSTLAVESSAAGEISGPSPADLSADVDVTVPFSRDRGATFSAAVEEAARRQYEGSRSTVQHTIASVAFEAASTYWSYLRAHRRLAAFQSSERRASQLVSETQVLIQADERPASDIHLIRANLAAKQTQRVLAEQMTVEAQHSVGLAMGLTLPEIVALPRPGTPFPEPVEPSPADDPGFVSRAVDHALAHRQDLDAIRNQTYASARLRDAAVRQLRPRVDFNVSFSYSGDEVAVAQRSRRLGTAVELRYEPYATSDQRAQTLRTESTYLRDTTMMDDLARHITSQVAVAVSGWRAAESHLARARDTVRLAELGLESEKKNFQLGLSALFDAIQAEDALTNALLSEVDAQFGFATALVKVRFETGDLVVFDEAGPHVDLQRPFAGASAGSSDTFRDRP